MHTNARSIFELLTASAIAYGDREAIRVANESLRYSELMDRANRLATLLHDRGARPGAFVAHSFTKSIEAVVALFAIARTGAAYVPIDPAWPAARSAMIVEDAGIRVWTGSKPPPVEMASRIDTVFSSVGGDGVNTVPISALCDADRMRGDIPAPERGIANLLFTSGSTGRPKGVEITTESLLHFAKWGSDYFELTPNDVLANHAPYNFDLSTFDIFAAVCAGAAMRPVPERVKMFPYSLAQFIANEGVTVWYSVPSALAMIQQRGRIAEHDLRRLRHVIFAGEVMPKPTVRWLAEQLPHVALTNLYGPTETNVCTYHRVTADEFSSDDALPIGRPISDTRAWIMDENGIESNVGELLIAGPTVTTGYWKDDQLTARRLVEAPDGPGVAYRTGDRVRRSDDGILMFEGRIDRMIKCRGHRIEPGEVETALYALSAVRQAAVIAVADETFGHRLRACVSFSDGATISEAALIAHCRGRLPAYMVPDEWEIRATLPQTDRGKIDLQALAR